MDSKRARLSSIVGEGNVCDDSSVLEGYSQDHSFVPARRPWFVVRPQTVEQVQSLVLWANESQTPLVPVSSGPPHMHGDTVPSLPEAVIVDLSGMKAIKRIDRRNKVTVIEPGVTYSELEPALAREGLRICRPLLPRPNKSVIASLLERQPTLIPRFNYTLPEPLRDCGVVWGTGEISFTGEAGFGPLSLEKQWQAGVALVDPKGPFSTDLMRLLTGAQGSMGIVIWAAVKCELVPSVHKYMFVPGEKLEDLIEFCYKLERLRLGDEVMVLNSAQLASALGPQPGDVPLLRQDLPPWVVVVGLAGAAYCPQERVDVQELQLKRMAQEFGVKLLPAVPGVTTAAIEAAVGGCSGNPYWKLKSKGGCQDIFFLTTLDKTPEFVKTVYATAEAAQYPVSEIGIYIQPQHHGVSQHVEFSLPYDPANERSGAGQAGLHPGERGTHSARGVLLAALWTMGRPGIQPRCHRDAGAAHGKTDCRSQERVESRKAVLLSATGIKET